MALRRAAVLFLSSPVVFGAQSNSLYVSSLKASPLFPVPLVDFAALSSLDKSTSTQLLHELSSLGIVGVSGIPGYAAARTLALSNIAGNCLVPGAATSQVRHLYPVMPDSVISWYCVIRRRRRWGMEHSGEPRPRRRSRGSRAPWAAMAATAPRCPSVAHINSP